VKRSNALWMALAISAAGLGAVLGFVRTGKAQTEPELVTCRADFPVVGIVGGESGRVHATWVSSEGATDPLNVRIQFFDTSGRLLKEETLALAPGTDVASELVAPKTGGKVASRLEFRADVQVQPSNGDPGFPADTGCPEVLTSLELISGGRTFLFVPPGCAVGRHCPGKCNPSPSPTPTPPTIDGMMPDASFPMDTSTPPPLTDMTFPMDLATPPPLTDMAFPDLGPPSD
jgi:hypothetical protein